MPLGTHLYWFAVGTGAWVVFWVMGLPSYYQQYSTFFMVVFDALALPVLTVFFLRSLRRSPPGRRLALSLWMAFYFTVPIAFYDWLYCGVYLGHGMGFLGLYWYLSIYYIIPWLHLPACAAYISRKHP